MLQDRGSSSIGGVLVHSFDIDVKRGEKKNISINEKGGDCWSRLSLMSIWSQGVIKADKRSKCKSGSIQRIHIGSITCNVCPRRIERNNSSKEAKRNHNGSLNLVEESEWSSKRISDVWIRRRQAQREAEKWKAGTLKKTWNHRKKHWRNESKSKWGDRWRLNAQETLDLRDQ